MTQVIILGGRVTGLAVNCPRRPVGLELDVPLDGVHATLHVAVLLAEVGPLVAPVLVTLTR